MIEPWVFYPTAETVDHFKARYLRRFPKTIFGKTKVVLACTCEDGGGPTHWAAICNEPRAIADHLEHEVCLADLRKMGIES